MKAKTISSALAKRIAKIKSFDPNSPGLKEANVFGLPFTPEESEIVLIPVPWEATVSYGGGTSAGPAAILEASAQVDLYHNEFPELWKQGIAMTDIPKSLQSKSKAAKKLAAKIIDAFGDGKNPTNNPALKKLQEEVNKASEAMIKQVEKETTEWINKGKLVGLVGGDHSTPLGFFKALSKKYKKFGILQIDAHMDLRKAYEGFTYSHASIMYNALQIKEVGKLVQLGIRDFCEEENNFAVKNANRV
ncbi:MAG: arginase family protein, partial [Bacteroidota bacterium]